MDIWIFQGILFETKSDIVVKIGNRFGGSTLALAHLCDGLGKGAVIGVDLSHANIPALVRSHPRITLIEKDAVEVFVRVREMCDSDKRVLVIEDSSHTYENTLDVLRTNSVLVKPGGYFIVEDSICHHGLDVGPSPGPFEAVETFINETSEFHCDRERSLSRYLEPEWVPEARSLRGNAWSIRHFM